MGQAPYKTGPSVFLCHAGEDKDRFVEPFQTGIVEDKIIQDVADNIIKELPKTTKRSNAGCPIPIRPENGQVRFETRTHGSLATYTCTAGYDLAGLHMREAMEEYREDFAFEESIENEAVCQIRKQIYEKRTVKVIKHL
ncbi:hypothetical protein Bbelb_083310 [Branchiostoma belcheri]|nr:hypothetical protein Bbelb_083310 [Branchiostoma belcheri]